MPLKFWFTLCSSPCFCEHWVSWCQACSIAPTERRDTACLQRAPNLGLCLPLGGSPLSLSCRAEAARPKEEQVSHEKRTVCAKARTQQNTMSWGNSGTGTPTSPHGPQGLLKKRHQILNQDRSEVCSTALGTSTPHFWLTSSCFSSSLFYKLHFSHAVKLTCSLLFLYHWPYHFSGQRKYSSFLLCMVKSTCPSRPRSELTSSRKPTTLPSPAFCLK